MHVRSTYSPGVPVGAFIRSLGAMAVVGALGVYVTPLNPIGGVGLMLASLVMGIALLQADGTGTPSGAQAMDELHTEIECRTVVHGESLGFRTVTPERSLTRRL